MAYEGKETEYQEQGWRLRDIIFLTSTLGTAGLIATVVTGTTVVGGGLLLLLASPLLLLFSPILVPGTIIFTVLGGGALALAAVAATGVGLLTWLYNYLAGGKPPGAESVDTMTGQVRGWASYAGQKVADVTHLGQQKGQEAYGAAQQTGQQALAGVKGTMEKPK